MKTTSQQVHIRWLNKRDVPEVLKIEHDSFSTPLSEEELSHWLRQRNCIGIVAELDDHVVGYMVFEFQKTCFSVLRMVVHPQRRKQGIGAQFVTKLIGKLIPGHRHRIEFVIRESDLASQLFLKSSGFYATGVHRSYFEDSSEDAYVMVYAIPFINKFDPKNRIEGLL